jgi:hypothetical protein
LSAEDLAELKEKAEQAQVEPFNMVQQLLLHKQDRT